MNKCIVFFIVLVLVLVAAVFTDNKSAISQENNLVEHKVDTNNNKNLVENKTVADRRYWKFSFVVYIGNPFVVFIIEEYSMTIIINKLN